MTCFAESLTALTHNARRRFTAVAAAGALVLTGIAGSATPARADTADDLLRLFLGAAAVAVVVRAFDQNRRPTPGLGRNVLPEACEETVRIRGRTVETYNARCLDQAGVRGLPGHCQMDMRTDRGQRRSYLAQCLHDAGFRAERGGGWRPQPVPQPDVRPGRPGRPQAGLPRYCEMTYRERGARVAGYDGQCLSQAGVRNLPRHCRVSDGRGQHYFNAECLRNAGFRPSRR